MSYVMTILFLALAIVALTALMVAAAATLLYRAAGLGLPAALARGAAAFGAAVTLGLLLLGLVVSVLTR
jgi:hypothetical protein